MKILDLIEKILYYGFLVIGLIVLFFGIGKQSLVIASFISFLAAWGLGLLIKAKGINKKYNLFIYIGLWLNLAGEYFYYYSSITYYDKILHFSIGILITLIVYEYYTKSLKVKKDMIFFTVLGMLATWEIIEYVITYFFNYPMVGVYSNGIMIMSPYDDTLLDLIFGTFGSLIYLFFKKEKIDKGIRKEIKNIKNRNKK